MPPAPSRAAQPVASDFSGIIAGQRLHNSIPRPSRRLPGRHRPGRPGRPGKATGRLPPARISSFRAPNLTSFPQQHPETHRTRRITGAAGQPSVKGSRVPPVSSTHTDLFSVYSSMAADAVLPAQARGAVAAERHARRDHPVGVDPDRSGPEPGRDPVRAVHVLGPDRAGQPVGSVVGQLQRLVLGGERVARTAPGRRSPRGRRWTRGPTPVSTVGLMNRPPSASSVTPPQATVAPSSCAVRR